MLETFRSGTLWTGEAFVRAEPRYVSAHWSGTAVDRSPQHPDHPNCAACDGEWLPEGSASVFADDTENVEIGKQPLLVYLPQREA